MLSLAANTAAPIKTMTDDQSVKVCRGCRCLSTIDHGDACMKKIVLVISSILFVVLPVLGCNSEVTNVPSASSTVTVTAQPLFPEPHLLFTAATVLLGIALILVARVWKNQPCPLSATSISHWLYLFCIVSPIAVATLFSALAAISIYPIMIGWRWGQLAGTLYGHGKWLVFVGLCLLTIGLILHGILALRSIIRPNMRE